MAEWASESAVNLTRALREKEISAQELLEYFVARCERLNPGINAIVARNLTQARAVAKQADEALAKGELLGPLHGLPMTLKDNLEFVGMPTTHGAPEYADFQPDANLDVVQDVLDAGAVVYGKTNLPYMGMDTQSFNAVYGQTNNPWDTSVTPGGSSGGAAAAVAAGLVGLEIGNDIGGSIRFPAHFCGIYGHKSSYGIVSSTGASKPWTASTTTYPPATDLAVNGPIARSAKDLALAMEIIAGAPRADRSAISIRLPEARKQNLADFKVGVWMDDERYPPDSAVGQVLGAFIERLRAVGVNLHDSKPDVSLQRSHRLRNQLEAATTSLMTPQDVYDEALNSIRQGAEEVSSWHRDLTITHREWQLLNAERAQIRERWREYFNEFDVLLCPVARIAAHAHDHTPIAQRVVRFNEETLAYWSVMGPWNALALVAYLPATVAPAGFTEGGLPVGIQIIGPYLEDMTPIQFAIELEQQVIGPYRLPPGFE